MPPAALSSTCSFNTLRQRRNGLHFPDDIFKYIFLNENMYILIKIPLKFVLKGPINNIPALVQIMAWHRPGDKPLSESMMVQFTDAYASMSYIDIWSGVNTPKTAADRQIFWILVLPNIKHTLETKVQSVNSDLFSIRGVATRASGAQELTVTHVSLK